MLLYGKLTVTLRLEILYEKFLRKIRDKYGRALRGQSYNAVHSNADLNGSDGEKRKYLPKNLGIEKPQKVKRLQREVRLNACRKNG